MQIISNQYAYRENSICLNSDHFSDSCRIRDEREGELDMRTNEANAEK